MEGVRNKIPIYRFKEIFTWATCSEVDYDQLMTKRWGLDFENYVICLKSSVRMNRFVKYALEGCFMEKNTVVDHNNNDKLDNTRKNLFIVSYRNNSQNRKKTTKPTSSKYIGVYYRKKSKGKSKPYNAAITLSNGKSASLGYYATEIEAAKARDIFILNQPIEAGFYHKLNFEELKDELKLKTPYVLKPHKSVGKKFHNVSQSGGRFTASVTIKKVKLLSLKFKSEIEAAKAVDACIVKHGLNKSLNFPDMYPNYVQPIIIKTTFSNVDDCLIRLHVKSHPKAVLIIDKADYEKVSKYYVSVNSEGYPTVAINNSPMLLHRYLIGVIDPSILVDHEDSNPLNCSKSNLRVANHEQNGRNKQKRKVASSSYLGVCKKSDGKFLTQLQWKNFVYRKTHRHEEFAARDRDLVVMKMLPNDGFNKMNFEWDGLDLLIWAAILQNKHVPTRWNLQNEFSF